MMELIITSSVLILVVIVLRHFLKGKISLRLQYALWVLVLLRLLVPINFFSSAISVMNAVQKASAYAYAEKALEDTRIYSNFIRNTEMTPDEARKAGRGTLHEIQGYAVGSGSEHLHSYIFMDSLSAVLKWVLKMLWFAGTGIVGAILLLSNLGFGRKLRKTRIRYPADGCELPVYIVDSLPSPCLFGLFRPSIYITSEVTVDETKLCHVLAHELTHYRHGDHTWSALRGLSLAVHWYNPLVWLAATLSRRDSELACDEGTIICIGEEGRIEYGRTLIGLTCEKRKAMDLLSTATTMTDGKKGIKERITLIAKKPKRLVPPVIAVVLVAAVAVGCTFTGATRASEVVPLTTEELEQYNKAFEPLLYDEQGNPIGVNPVGQFLTSYYSKPEDLNLTEFLRYFPSDGDVTDEAEFESLKAVENWPFGADATLGDMPVPVHKFSAETVNTALKEYMGITLDDLSGVGSDELVYLKDYDAYYNFTSDAGFGSFVCTSGERQGDIVRLFGENAILTLKTEGGGFLIASHQRVDSTGKSMPADSASAATALIPTAPKLSPDQSVGIEMPELDYADDSIVIFHGYFGMFVYDLKTQTIIRSLDLAPIGCHQMQGSDACEVVVSRNGEKVFMHTMETNKMYVWDLTAAPDASLFKLSYDNDWPEPDERFKMVFIETVIKNVNARYSYRAVDFGNGEYGYLYDANDWTLSALKYIRSSDYDMAYELFSSDAADIGIRTIGKVPTVYTREEALGHTAVREVAEHLMTKLLDDLKTGQDGRSFTITHWKNLSVSADRMYDAWLVTGQVEVRYEGILSPVGDSGDLNPKDEYVSVSIGQRYLRNEGGVYTLSLSAGDQQAVLEPPLLTSDMSIGVGVDPDYADDDILIFHGYFGLFVYDLKAEKITFAADLKKAVGTTIIQGSEGVAVRVSADGNTIQLYFYPEQGEPKMAYTIDSRSGGYTYGRYAALDAYDTSAADLYDRFSYGTLGELTYTDGKKSWLLFSDWDWTK